MSTIDTASQPDTALCGASVEDYFALLKPRVMSLVVFTALAGMLLAPIQPHPVIALAAILAIAVGAGASGALNMWYDADIDAIMSRTANRPIPAGRMGRAEALGFGFTLSAFSVATLGLATNWLAAGLLAFTIFFYAVIYTMWLKRRTPQNIVIGGASGAFPPMIGWAAMTGSIGLQSVILFLIIFLWTPPHFWSLALYKQSDYAAAGIPMMPNAAGDGPARTLILIYSGLLTAVSLVPVLAGFAGWPYAAAAVPLGLAFTSLAIRLRRSDGSEMRRRARSLFAFSLVYLFAVFLALLADHWLAGQMGGL